MIAHSRGVLTLELARDLATDAGRDLLEFGSSLPADPIKRVTALRKRCGAALAGAVAEQVELRSRAAVRFSVADSLLFTREGLEQSSAETIATWRASRMPTGARVLDLCAGIGSDAAAFARAGQVLACDRDPLVAWCAHYNLLALGLEQQASVVCADARTLNLHADAIFLDPSRRIDGRRVRSHADYSPPLEFVNHARRYVQNVVVKVSPALDIAEFPFTDARVEYVSLRGECREAVLWFGEIGPAAARSASVLPYGFHLDCNSFAVRPKVAEPSQWLFDPDPAIVRAHLIWEAAALTGCHLMDEQIAFLTASAPSAAVPGSWYEIACAMPFNLKHITEKLRSLGGRVGVVKRRGVPMDPDELRLKLRRMQGEEYILVVTRVRNAPTALLCLPPRNMHTEAAGLADI